MRHRQSAGDGKRVLRKIYAEVVGIEGKGRARVSREAARGFERAETVGFLACEAGAASPLKGTPGRGASPVDVSRTGR